jgi:hypothetical protein
MPHYCDVFQNGAHEIEIHFCEGADLEARISQFLPVAGLAVPEDQPIVEAYAQASYLRHASYFTSAFSIDPVRDWIEKRTNEQEAIVLMEAWQPGRYEQPRALLGVLLLRSSWSRDIAIDYVVTNRQLARQLQLRETGRKLVKTALQFAAGYAAPLVWVETAKDSSKWWKYLNPELKQKEFLSKGEDFVRYSEVMKAKTTIESHFDRAGTKFKYVS